MYPTPWVGYHAHMVACDCPPGLERNHRLRAALGEDDERLYGGDTHRQALLLASGHAAWVDEGIRADIERLWGAGIWTENSCEGSDGHPRYVTLTDYRQRETAGAMLPWAVTESSQMGKVSLYGEDPLDSPGECA